MEEDDVRAGASVHMWFSFGEFVHWNKDCTATRFVFDVDDIVPEFCQKMKDLLTVSGAPIFVNLCTSSSFLWNGDASRPANWEHSSVSTGQDRGSSHLQPAHVVRSVEFHRPQNVCH